MIEINDIAVREKVLDFLVLLKIEQKKVQDIDPNKVLYPCISLKYALKNNIVIPGFLTHKFCLKQKDFYEGTAEVTSDKDVLDLVTQILEYELTCDLKSVSLVTEEINILVKFRNKLKKRLFKKEKADEPTNTLQ